MLTIQSTISCFRSSKSSLTLLPASNFHQPSPKSSWTPLSPSIILPYSPSPNWANLEGQLKIQCHQVGTHYLLYQWQLQLGDDCSNINHCFDRHHHLFCYYYRFELPQLPPPLCLWWVWIAVVRAISTATNRIIDSWYLLKASADIKKL